MSTNEATADAQTTDSTPDATPQAEPARQDHSEADKPEMTIEDYKSALEKVRKEAARYRTENKELRPLAERAKEAEEAGKSELQKAQERIAALEAEKQESVLAAARAELSAKHGVPADLIFGEDPEAMERSAASLASFVDKRVAEQGTPHLPPVGSVGRASGGNDRDAQAREILGLK
ncbi:hypothetical protein ACN4DJ_05825 [Corynebacterium macclintockiae]